MSTVDRSVLMGGTWPLKLAWRHLISWYKQMYDVLLSVAGNYIVNKFPIYFWSKSVAVCDPELEIILIFHNIRIIRIRVHVSRMGDVYRLYFSVP